MLEETKPEINSETKPEKINLSKITKWSFEHDELLSNWGDHAACYTWMHDTTQRKFSKINMYLGIPVIILSTVSGTANFGISTIFPAGFGYGNAIIGTLSLITGVISTVSNFLGYAQAEEAHRISGIQWSKFRRTIETELSLHPEEREPPGEFIKHCKAELDRLMEQSPLIPKDVVDKFIRTFRKIKNVKMPEICNKLEPTTLYSELFDMKMNKKPKNEQELVLNTSDKNIISSIKEKLSPYFSSTPKPKDNKDSEDADVVIEVKNENLENYSNTVSKEEKNKLPPVPDLRSVISLKPNDISKNPLKGEKLMNKQLVYGKK